MHINWYGKVPGAAEFVGVGQWADLQLLADVHLVQEPRQLGSWYAQAQQLDQRWQVTAVMESQDQFQRRFPLLASLTLDLPDESYLAIPDLCLYLAEQVRLKYAGDPRVQDQCDPALLIRRSLLAFEQGDLNEIHDQLSVQEMIIRFAALARAVSAGDELLAVPHIYSPRSAQMCLWLGQCLRHAQPHFIAWRNFSGVSAHDFAWSWQEPQGNALNMLRSVPAGPAAMQVRNAAYWDLAHFEGAGMNHQFLQTFIRRHAAQAVDLANIN